MTKLGSVNDYQHQSILLLDEKYGYLMVMQCQQRLALVACVQIEEIVSRKIILYYYVCMYVNVYYSCFKFKYLGSRLIYVAKNYTLFTLFVL